MEVCFDNKQLEVDNVKKSSGIRGLMFRRRQKANALILNSERPIHSFFVFFDFLALWLNSDDKIVDWKVVKPWSVHEKSGKPFSKILEIPINNKYHSQVKFIVGEKFKNNKVLK